MNFREFKLLSLSVLLAICGSLGLDIHLASLPTIMRYMHTTDWTMQQSVTLYILGIGVSILIYGPLSDNYGRKPVILFGLSLAFVASLLAAFSKAILSFLGLRLLQGIGCGVCWGLGRIIAADIMQGERLAALGSYFTLFLSLSSLFAPALGGYIQHWFGWQANFIVLGLVILLVLVLFTLFFEETNQHINKGSFSIKQLVKTYLSFKNERLFIGAVLLSGIALSANIIYTTVSPFIFQQEFHTSPIMFGWLTATIGVAGILGKLIAPFFILRLKNHKTMWLGLCILVLSGVYLSVFAFVHRMTIASLLFGVALAIIALIFIGTTSMAMALSPFHKRRGSAGALFSAFQLIIAFIFAAGTSAFPHLDSDTLAISYCVLGFLGTLSYLFLIKQPSVSSI